MKHLLRLISRTLRNESGAEVTELGIVLALVVAAAVATMAAIGPKLVAAYNTVNNALPN